MDWRHHPRKDNPIKFFKFEKRVFSVDYPQSQMIALDSERQTKRTGGLMSMHNVNLFTKQYLLCHRIICHIIGKHYICGDYDKGQVVCFNSVDIPHSVVIRRIAMCDNNDFSDSLF